MPWTDVQQKHLSIWPHFTGTLSMIGSGLIIYEVLRDPQKRRKVYHRLLLAMSICDLNTSFWYFLSTWPIPEGTKNVFAPSGTPGSCTAQGFFVQFGIATPIYNAVLAVYYLLIIRYQWKEKQVKKAEKFFHAVPLTWATATSFAALGLTLLNNANLWCWIASVPLSCTGSRRNGGVNDCERGNNAWIYRWAFFYGPLWAAIVLSGVAMFLTYASVRKAEEASSKWKHKSQANINEPEPTDNGIIGKVRNSITKSKKDAESKRKHSKQVSTQAFYYLLAFFFSWTPATLTRLIQMIWGKTYYPIILLMAIFTPMQGFLNYLVYMRPRWIAYRKKHAEWSIFRACCMLCRKHEGDEEAGESTRGRRRGANFSAVPSLSSFRLASRKFSSTMSRRSSIDGPPPISDVEECKQEESEEQAPEVQEEAQEGVEKSSGEPEDNEEMKNDE